MHKHFFVLIWYTIETHFRYLDLGTLKTLRKTNGVFWGSVNWMVIKLTRLQVLIHSMWYHALYDTDSTVDYVRSTAIKCKVLVLKIHSLFGTAKIVSIKS